jgi:hypothetical protein
MDGGPWRKTVVRREASWRERLRGGICQCIAMIFPELADETKRA